MRYWVLLVCAGCLDFTPVESGRCKVRLTLTPDGPNMAGSGWERPLGLLRSIDVAGNRAIYLRSSASSLGLASFDGGAEGWVHQQVATEGACIEVRAGLVNSMSMVGAVCTASSGIGVVSSSGGAFGSVSFDDRFDTEGATRLFFDGSGLVALGPRKFFAAGTSKDIGPIKFWLSSSNGTFVGVAAIEGFNIDFFGMGSMMGPMQMPPPVPREQVASRPTAALQLDRSSPTTSFVLFPDGNAALEVRAIPKRQSPPLLLPGVKPTLDEQSLAVDIKDDAGLSRRFGLFVSSLATTNDPYLFVVTCADGGCKQLWSAQSEGPVANRSLALFGNDVLLLEPGQQSQRLNLAALADEFAKCPRQ
jgi:hypothetical protein